MTASIQLPDRTEPLSIEVPPWSAKHPSPKTRRVYAAAHVAAADATTIDWESTLAFRDHLWSHGFAVAEAMDTAQRGMGLSWAQTQELIGLSTTRARRCGGAVACGAGTDQLPPGDPQSLGAIVGAYEQQIDLVQSAGAEIILMASRALAATARSRGDYLQVYGHLLKQLEAPVILHWLGEAFDPALAGYWGGHDFDRAADTVLSLIDEAGGAVAGVKLSVLDAGHELALRRRLPAGVRLYTGDDYNYAELIRGDADGHSDALLGVFAAIAAPAAEALEALDAGDLVRYDAVMGATVPLARTIFEAPTFNYKTGIAFLAWLNGFQAQFVMLDHFEDRRPLSHLVEVFERAGACGALAAPDLAVERMSQYLAGRSRP